MTTKISKAAVLKVIDERINTISSRGRRTRMAGKQTTRILPTIRRAK